MPRPRPARAFTLTEVTLVAVIISIISAIAIPRFGASLARYRAERASCRLKADLLLARDKAIHQGRAFTVSFITGTASSYTLIGLRDPDRSTADTTVILSREPYLTTLGSLSVGPDTSIIFDGFGIPDSAGSMVLSVGSATRTLTIDGQSGEVTLSTP
jgi:prepilin-type N-terminal cleavage/methylation domain-containing protein